MDTPVPAAFTRGILLNAFRTHYHRFQTAITDLVAVGSDAMVIARLGDDLDEFSAIVEEVSLPLYRTI